MRDTLASCAIASKLALSDGNKYPNTADAAPEKVEWPMYKLESLEGRLF
jgi:hypothetical protein